MATTEHVDPDMFTSLATEQTEITEVQPVSEERAFITKCLHPPTAVAGFNGIPTNDARSQVLLEWRNLWLSGSPNFNDGGTIRPVTPLPTEYAYLIPSGAHIMQIGYCASEDNKWRQDTANTYTQDLYDFKNWEYDATIYRPVYRSLTTYLNATYFNNTGFVAVYQFNPSLLFQGLVSEMWARDFKLFHRYVRALFSLQLKQRIDVRHSVDLSKSITDFPKHIRDEIVGICNELGTRVVDMKLDPNTKTQIINLGLTNNPYGVPSMSQTLQGSQRSYSGKAMEGTFSVTRMNTIAPSWLTASNTLTPQFGLYECWTYTLESNGNNHLVPLYDNGLINNPASIIRDTMWSSDFTWHWVHYTGLSYNSMATPAANMTNFLVFKHYTGFEVQPSPKSAWSGLIRLAPKPNMELLQDLERKFFDLKDGMPARFNMLGEFIGAIPSVVNGIKDLVTGGNKEEKTENVNYNVNELAKLMRGANISHQHNPRRSRAAPRPRSRSVQPRRRTPKRAPRSRTRTRSRTRSVSRRRTPSRRSTTPGRRGSNRGRGRGRGKSRPYRYYR